VLNTANSYCKKRFNYDSDVRFIFERIGFSAKMNELEAAIGLGYLKIYPQIFKKRMKNFLYIRERFKQFEDTLATINPGTNEEMAPYAFPVILNDGLPFTRNEMVAYLEKNGIDTRSLFLSMPTQCAGFKFLGHKLGEFPEAEFVSDNGFHIGIHQDINEEHIDYFIELTKQFLNKYR